jgi:hypothetical protein
MVVEKLKLILKIPPEEMRVFMFKSKGIPSSFGCRHL